MRDDIPGWVLRESHTVRTVVDALYDGDTIAEDLPLDAGTLGYDTDSPVPGRLDLSFPVAWAPRSWRDPLAAYGQRLTVRQVLGIGPQQWTVNLGQFLIQGWDYADASVAVEALSLEQVLLDYQMPAPYKRSGTTYASNMANLCRGLVAVDTSAMTDKTLATGVYSDWTYGTTHLTAVRALADEWDADLAVDPDGILTASPRATVATTPHITWTHGQADAYITVGGGGLRDDLHNGVIVYADTDTGAISAFASDSNPTSPTYFDGPFGKRVRTESYNLDNATKDAVSKTAQTFLAKELRRTAVVTVTAPPDPRIEVGDTARVTLDDGRTFTGLVTGVQLPLTPLDGPATYDVAVDGRGL